MTRLELRAPDRQRPIKGVLLPDGIRYRQIIVTGPPGSGKSTLVGSLAGWPEEGYIDLGRPAWWRSRDLALRPRQVHLGVPFVGQPESLAMFEPTWVDNWDTLRLAKTRIRLAPERRIPSLFDWRTRFVFLFLLPTAEEVLQARQERSQQQTHPIDIDLSLEMVQRQLEIYAEIAQQFHNAGLRVFVRDSFGGDFKAFASGSELTFDSGARSSTPEGLRAQIGKVFGSRSHPRVDHLKSMRLEGEGVCFPSSLLPVEIRVGKQRIQVQRETYLDGTRNLPDTLLLVDPDQYEEGISAFVRLTFGRKVRFRSGGEDRWISQRMPEDVPPRLEIGYDGDDLTVVDLHSPGGTEIEEIHDQAKATRLSSERTQNLAQLRQILKGTLELTPEESLATLQEVLVDLRRGQYRPSDSDGNPGGLVELPDALTPILVGDLHAQLDNLLKILIENRFLAEIEAGRACLILMGDLIHREESGHTHEMESSLVITDVVIGLMRAFPGRVLYMRGNHDSFSHEVTKDGVLQGHLWLEHVLEHRGPDFRKALKELYDLLPYVIVCSDLVVCHAGPPLDAVTRQKLVDVRKDSRLRHQLTWNRLRTPNNPGGYTKRDIKAFKRALDRDPHDTLVVSHNPQSDDGTLWLEAGGITAYHILYGARDDQVAVVTRVEGDLVPLVYPVEPLIDRILR